MSTFLSQSPKRQVATLGFRRPLGRVRTLIITLAAILAMLSATIVIGQSSQDFDLACRSIMSAGGGAITGGNFGVIAALGLPIVPPKDSETAPTYAIRGGNFAVRTGFLPGYPNQPGATTVDAAAAPAVPEQDFVQRLPLINKVRILVRGGC